MASDTATQTKRQKKAARFRAKQRGDAEKDTTTVYDTNEFPTDVSTPALPSEPLTNDAASAPETKTKTKANTSAKKMTFDEEGIAHETSIPPVESKEESKDTAGKYIVFVGNMSYDVTAEMLAKHMHTTCGELPKVRLLTKKGDPTALEKLSNSKKKSIAKGKAKDPSAPVSKGCAFVEFTSSTAMQKALRFHHTMFQGRQINVELTAGGGGKSQHRREKIKAKNAELEKERRKLHEKYVKPEAEAQKRKQAEKEKETSTPTAHWGPSQEKERPAKRAKFASGANAVRLG
ncbi:hypothetical protein ACI68E_000942 [Malassezia pachydermatis]|uniref:Nop6-protein with possible role in rrna processing n=1 Tax=Malassezia pachydermatis TaxID=77020 RepID=A0A0M8MN19_9BASI|nr:nop6-protein with possible role in rrna processing [Malassezia pachydermatis]KOS15796.1 nop6-protein with possible role in rrna processing [Malassezia pachydermatis]